MALTSEAKSLLAETIRGTKQDPAKGLRHRLLEAIQSEAAGRYRLAVPIKEAGLDEAHRRRRERLEAYLDEKIRATKPKSSSEGAKTRERLLREAEKEAAATLLNRLITLRLLEAQGLSRSPIASGGWNSKGYREFRDFAPTLIDDATEGYAFLLQLVFEDLATDLPGLFGDVGVTTLFPIPPKALRDVVETLDDSELASAWTDDVTLGWVYQYWNDPDREALDWKISPKGGGGKILPHEIASKTQMFTERYMVEWLLQNSLGLTWLSMCKKHGWTADVDRVLPVLDARRADWRKSREVGTVALDALMPIHGESEEHWRYYVSQLIPADAVEKAPESVRVIKLLDPACGSGHFLIIAFDLLAALYREEARHLGTTATDKEIAESILENNLHGIDIDPRAIQIAAAALYLKAKSFSRSARPKRINLVAPVLQLGNLPADDPAVAALRKDLKQEVGIPEELTTKLLSALAGVDFLGSLLKVDAAIEGAIKNVELEFERSHGQGNLFGGFPAQQVKLSVGAAKATILDKLEQFLAKHSNAQDLGIRLDGEQLAAGVRFVRMAKEGTYNIVVGNPPYQGLSKTESFNYVIKTYPRSKADLYAAFLERGLELAKPGGVSALLTMRGWMFLSQFADVRRYLLRERRPALIVDLHFGAFSEMKDVSVGMTVVYALPGNGNLAVALRPVATPFVVRDVLQPARNVSGLLAPAERYEFEPWAFEVIDGEPIVYWWSKDFLKRYEEAPKLGDVAPVRQGAATSANARFLRCPWEVPASRLEHLLTGARAVATDEWTPYVKGAQGQAWFEPLSDLIRWGRGGLEVRAYAQFLYGSYTRSIKNEEYYFRKGISYSTIGSAFVARAQRYGGVFDVSGSSVFPENIPDVLCLMNATTARLVLQSLNPTVNFQVGDVNRLPIFPISESAKIFELLDGVFRNHEACRETSIEFLRPGTSSWQGAQDWAQRAVDRLEDARLPEYEPAYEHPTAQSFVSFAIGVALGRFSGDGAGIIAVDSPDALPNGILFVSAEGSDSLAHPVSAVLLDAWKEHGGAVGGGDDLRTYLRTSFFTFHKKLYETRPIYFPLTSKEKSFVAFVSIHRWADDTLSVLLADHLLPAKKRLEGELDDLRTAKASEANRANGARAERRFMDVQKLLEELNDFVDQVIDIAERGPPPSDEKTKKREVDARFAMDLGDGVLVNSSAMWPLLEPVWKDPKKWWKQLANSEGKKDYNWSQLAARYFPTRVRKRCQEEPSRAIAHACFWELHPAIAYAWELRLQDEIRPGFTIDEPGSDAARKKFLAERAGEASEILASEIKRRDRKGAKEEDQLDLLDEAAEDEVEDDSDE